MKWKVPEDFTVLNLRNGKTYEPLDGFIQIPDNLVEDCAQANQHPDLTLVTDAADMAESVTSTVEIPETQTEADRLGGSSGTLEAPEAMGGGTV